MNLRPQINELNSNYTRFIYVQRFASFRITKENGKNKIKMMISNVFTFHIHTSQSDKAIAHRFHLPYK